MAIPVYVINLDRRPDRLSTMKKQLDLMEGVEWHRIAAVDAKSVRRRGAFLDAGTFACQLSHLKAIQAFLDTTHQFAAILEDDVELSPHFPLLLESAEWVPDDVGLIKLDIHGVRHLGDFCGCAPDGRTLQRMDGSSWSLAGYMLNRKAARKILGAPEHKLWAIDTTLFHQPMSKTARALKPVALSPAAVRIQDSCSGSDIAPTRAGRSIRVRLARLAVRLRWFPQKVIYLLFTQKSKPRTKYLHVPFR